MAFKTREKLGERVERGKQPSGKKNSVKPSNHGEGNTASPADRCTDIDYALQCKSIKDTGTVMKKK